MIPKFLQGRIHITFQDPQEQREYEKLYGWRARNGIVNIEDCWVNRLIVGAPIERPEYVAQGITVDGLFDFQRADLEKLTKWGSSLNGNYMGLGKTIECLGTAQMLGLHKILVFTKKTCITQWVKAVKEWYPGLKCIGHYSKSQKLPKLNDVDVIVTNYEKLVGNYMKVGKVKKPVPNSFGEYLCSQRWDMIVADEAHYIKNIDSARHILIDKLPSLHRTALTGTPIVNKPDDLFGILSWINPHICGKSYWTFVDYFCEVDAFNPFGRKIIGLTHSETKQKLLNELLSHIMVRNKLEDVLPDMPPVTESVITFDMEPKQQKLYTSIKKLTLEELPEALNINNAMVQTIRLRQQCTCPKILDPEAPWGPKFEYIKDTVENNPGIKLLIFSPFSTVVNALVKYLESERIACGSITGQLTAIARNRSLEDFQQDRVQVLACTIGSAGTGFDGLQKACNTVMFLDKEWGPEDMRQAISRLRRIGQENPVSVFYLECAKSIDQYIGKINITKIEDIRKILNEEDAEIAEQKYHLL